MQGYFSKNEKSLKKKKPRQINNVNQQNHKAMSNKKLYL